jgi:hypothetical protein
MGQPAADRHACNVVKWQIVIGKIQVVFAKIFLRSCVIVTM